MLRRLLIVCLMAGLAVPVVASPCLACSCFQEGTNAEHRRKQARDADLIFTGVAKSQSVVDEGDPEFEGDEVMGTRFRVRKTYKGHPGRFVTVSSMRNEASCGVEFEMDQRYTVFAEERRSGYETNLCSGTKRGGINPERYGLD